MVFSKVRFSLELVRFGPCVSQMVRPKSEIGFFLRHWGTMMDSGRFDSLARAVGGELSRRRAVVAAISSMLGMSVSTEDSHARAIACRPGARYCTNHRQCCSGQCRLGRKFPMASRNTCECPAPYVLCGKACRDLQKDDGNCGACGRRVDSSSERCCDGAPSRIDVESCAFCGDACLEGETCCGPEGGCADLSTDTENCGACGVVCDAGDICCGGVCRTLGTAEACAACGDVCSSGESCESGGCVTCDCTDRCGSYCDGYCPPCPTGWTCDTASNICEEPPFCAAADAVKATYVSVDNPTQTWDAVANNANAKLYANPDDYFGGNPNVKCTASSDCSACPTSLVTNATVVGCGCLKGLCDNSSDTSPTIYGGSYFQTTPEDTYYCWVVFAN